MFLDYPRHCLGYLDSSRIPIHAAPGNPDHKAIDRIRIRELAHEQIVAGRVVIFLTVSLDTIFSIKDILHFLKHCRTHLLVMDYHSRSIETRIPFLAAIRKMNL